MEENSLISPHTKSSNCGKALKLFQPSKNSNISYGSRNELKYGKIEIDARKEIGNPQPSAKFNFSLFGMQFID